MNAQKKLLVKIKAKEANIAVIGLGYVGLPLTVLLAKQGFTVKGYVKTAEKLQALQGGISGISGHDNNLKKILNSGSFSAYNIADSNLADNDIYIICVPTPLNKKKKPDLTSVLQVAKRLFETDLKGKLIINESTVAPFTTRKIFASSRMNYFLVCSPERIDPGTRFETSENIPKVIGGIDSESLELGIALYNQIIKKKLVVVGDIEVAEMSKMLENTYRAVNIALINEFAKLADVIGIDMLEVISASKTKWSFQPHYPGIGVGGHCIPVDPHYLLKLAQKKRIEMNVTTEALSENEKMPEYIAEKIIRYYKKGMNVLVYGLTYKKNVADLRESPVLVLCNLLKRKKIDFTVYDPLIPAKTIQKLGFSAVLLKKTDIFVVGTDHKQLAKDYKFAIGNKTVVIDGRNFFLKKVGKIVIGVGRSLVE